MNLNGSGVYSGGKISNGDLDKLEILDGTFALGHNLLSVNGTDGLQPVGMGKFVLVCNGEIYNFRELKEEFHLDSSDSSNEVILDLIRKFYTGSLKEALNETIKYLDGDYAFAVYDGIDMAVIRDPIGVKPVYYGTDQSMQAFASERKALWEIGIQDARTLPPGYMLHNWELVELDENLKTIKDKFNIKFNQGLKVNLILKPI